MGNERHEQCESGSARDDGMQVQYRRARKHSKRGSGLAFGLDCEVNLASVTSLAVRKPTSVLSPTVGQFKVHTRVNVTDSVVIGN